MYSHTPLADFSAQKIDRVNHSNYLKIKALNGNIKSIKSSSYKTHVMDGKIEFSIHLFTYLHYYSKSGHVEYALSLDQENNILWEYHYIWNHLFNSLNCKCLNSNKEVVELFSYHFNEEGEMIGKQCFSNNGLLLWENITGDFHTKNALEEISIEHIFNEFNEEIECREISPSGSVHTQTFEYKRDHHQNWIRKIERTKPLCNITSITKRTIEYYDD